MQTTQTVAQVVFLFMPGIVHMTHIVNNLVSQNKTVDHAPCQTFDDVQNSRNCVSCEVCVFLS
jgi:hypothetical protein